MKKGSLLLFILFCAGYLFAAGSNDSGGGITNELTVAVVVNTSDVRTARASMDEWAKQNKVKINYIEENTQTYASSYVLASKTQNPRYDLIMFWDFYLDQLYQMLTPLDGSYNAEYDIAKINNDDILSAGISKYKGHLYNVPYGLDSYIFYYRKDLFEQAGIKKIPETWDELIACAQKLTKDTNGDGNIDQWGLATNGVPGQVFNTYSFFNFLLTNGGKVVDTDGRPLFNSTAGIEALQFMVDLRNKYKVMPPDVITYDNNKINEGFLSGKFAMLLHWPYIYGMTYGTAYEGKIGFAPVPHSVKGTAATPLNAWSFGIPLMSKRKDLAWDLAKYLLSTEAGAFEFSKRRDWPFRRSAYIEAEKKYTMPADFSAFSNKVFEIASTNAQKIVMARGGETSIILSDYIDRAMTGIMTPKAALDAAVRDINNLLNN
ncbi:sugar ABC transporter substrate-binding protein [Treponema sp. Marseille-Q4523]|uniref:ABC transporter substrate-binding protein n=1 Tax=Treponema sp. Marseille-Q4523 TaxID=2810610 RepID=UPI001960689D|nr:sugar ABC transporter substrate-binding protein [Treponema sp. Marseille-Q4523]MBM7022807.1 sugar ABC transporter substrate-binding protein [Treponema sp. Marseille-Q4523]